MRQIAKWMLLGWVLFASATSAQAVIIAGGDGSGNISAPSDDPGWANVGRVNSSSCVYLGNGWVITANHVKTDGINTVTLNGNSYNSVSGSWHRLHDPSNPSQEADLGLFQLQTIPEGLSSLSISSTTPVTGSELLGIGYGKDRNDETWWNAAWQEKTGMKVYTGFYWDSTNSKRWGTNNISGTTTIDGGSYGTTAGLLTVFSNAMGDDEMQAALNDSGGGAFYAGDSGWELAGIILSVSRFSGQPSNSAVYGNETGYANLSVYRNEILSIVPEPSSLALFVVGIVSSLLFWYRRKR
jgi:hypothetical protein